MSHIFNFFVEAYQNTPTFQIILEAIAFVFGITSVWFAKQENIFVYPTGIICTVITVYLLYVNQYFGDMMMNFYYSIMSIYGWWNWSRKKEDESVIPISKTNIKEKQVGFLLCLATILITYCVYLIAPLVKDIITRNINFYEIITFMKSKIIKPNLEPVQYIDIVTSGIFFTAMWYMATKKLENWTLWIIGNLITIPLYAYRGLGMLSLQYIIFTILAIYGYSAWKKSLNNSPATA